MSQVHLISGNYLHALYWTNQQQRVDSFDTLSQDDKESWIERADRFNDCVKKSGFLGGLDVLTFWNPPHWPILSYNVWYMEFAGQINVAMGWFPQVSAGAAAIGYNFTGIAVPKADEDEKSDGQTPSSDLDTKYILVGTKFTMKNSGAKAEVTDRMCGKVKVTINKCESDWIELKLLQKDIVETL